MCKKHINGESVNEKRGRKEGLKMEENMIRGGILAMQVDNDTKTKLFNYLDNLVEDSNFLNCLRQAGVDNWNGYEDAQELFEEQDC